MTTVDVVKATEDYESWLAERITPIKADLELKHREMAAAPFPFLRATFYRWAQLWPDVDRAVARAPEILAAGDLHVENFGTWRDAEGRLVWGVNDLDEAAIMPYTVDLVRLAVSAELARRENHLTITQTDGCKALLEGYGRALETGGEPYVLEEKHPNLRAMATGQERAADVFWKKLDALPTLKEPTPASVTAILDEAMPESGLSYRVVHRIAGLGSLGRQRYTALADWRGGRIAREAKPLLPSAWSWAKRSSGPIEILYDALQRRAVRCPDPFLALRGPWIARRIGPSNSRVELASLPRERDEYRLMRAMGFETGNLHLGTKERIADVAKDLRGRPASWLFDSAGAMVKAVLDDWSAWKKAA